jgi:hypothetical protein
MRNLTLLCAAAIVASAASLSAAQAAGCAQYDPNCATYPMPKTDTSGIDQSRHHYGRANGPANVVGAAVGTAAGVAVGAVDTAGAIATAPFRGANSYAYYNGGDNGWNQQSYNERNGFVCTPGTWFIGADGRRHPCQ